MIWVLCKAEERAGAGAPKSHGCPKVLQNVLFLLMEVLPLGERESASLKFDVLAVRDRGPNNSEAATRGSLHILA